MSRRFSLHRITVIFGEIRNQPSDSFPNGHDLIMARKCSVDQLNHRGHGSVRVVPADIETFVNMFRFQLQHLGVLSKHPLQDQTQSEPPGSI